MPDRPTWQHNKTIELFPESEHGQRGVFEIISTHDVRWVQCHRCRRRFWYAISGETPEQERWSWGKRLRDRVLGQPCSEHVGTEGVR